MTDFFQQVRDIAPWAVNFFQFCIMAFIILRLTEVLREALGRAQSAGAPGVAAPTVEPAPAAPVSKPAPLPGAVTAGFVAWLKKEEGWSSKAYGDYKQYSIGYGTKAKSPTEVIDKAEGERRMMEELTSAVHEVDAFVPEGTPPGVRQALYDITYNAGSSWQHQGLGEHIKAKDWAAAKESFLQYVHADGKVLDDLVKRREAGAKMFDQPI